MRIKALLLSVVVWTLLGVSLVQGQGLLRRASGPGPGLAQNPAPEQLPAPTPVTPAQPALPAPSPVPVTDMATGPMAPGSETGPGPHGGGLSDWITNKRACSCHHPLGDDGPVRTEAYLRTGVAVPFGDSNYGDNLRVGWWIQGGARTLFFEPSCDRAWTIDLSLSHTHHDMQNIVAVPLNILVPNPDTAGKEVRAADGTLIQAAVVRRRFGQDGLKPVELRSLDRTFANIGGGRDWYLMGTQGCGQMTWRVGMDVGGGWGSARGGYFNVEQDVAGQPKVFLIPIRTDVIGRAYTGFHTDVELPCGCCVWTVGLRTEYSYTWTDILQSSNKADTQDLNILLNFGVRY